MERGPGGTTPNGTVFTDFLAKLNDCTSSNGMAVTSAGFAGHCDWRLPTIQELKTIGDTGAAGCFSGSPCIAPVFGPTADHYWSGTSSAVNPALAWTQIFDFLFIGPNTKGTDTLWVRAVRSGS